MAIGFSRPVGAVADVKELEYISAIAQTDVQHLRTDGSINGKCYNTGTSPSIGRVLELNVD